MLTLSHVHPFLPCPPFPLFRHPLFSCPPFLLFSQVRNILAEYMPLEDNASGRVHSPHTMRVAHGGGETDTAAMI